MTVIIFEFYEQKYLEKKKFQIEFGAVHQKGKIPYFFAALKVK